MKHFIAMAGLHGYLPNTCDVYETFNDACESMISLHELGQKRAATMKRDGYIELNLHRDGNEYAEIEECQCDEPWVHSDSDTEENWKRNTDWWIEAQETENEEAI